MNVDGCAKRFRALPEWMQRGMIEILTVGVAVDHGAAEFQVADAAFHFVGSGARVLHGQMPKAGIAIGSLGDLAGQKIVGLGGAPPRRRGIALDLHAGPGDRQHRARDAAAVHGLEPHIAEIFQAREQPAHRFLIDIAHGGQPIILKTRT
jgi:hypothetical protein